MRVLNYPHSSNNASLKNAFGYVIQELELVCGENALKPTSEGDYYQDSLGNVFFVYEGEGVLEWEDCLKSFDFSNLPLAFLQHFLSYKSHSPNANASIKRKIEEFIKVYDKNISKNALYLAPSNFKELDKGLILGEIRRKNDKRPH